MYGQFWTLLGLAWLMENGVTLVDPVAFTADTASGSPNLSTLSSAADLEPGMFVSGPGIPNGTHLLSVNAGASSAVMSANATATATTVAITAFGQQQQSDVLTVHLLTGGVPLSPTTTFAGLTEANYDGYLPQDIAYPMIGSSPDSANIAVSGQCMTFEPTDYLVSNQITGMAWTFTAVGASAPTLVAVEPFANPVVLNAAPQLIRLIPTLALPTNATGIVASPLLP